MGDDEEEEDEEVLSEDFIELFPFWPSTERLVVGTVVTLHMAREDSPFEEEKVEEEERRRENQKPVAVCGERKKRQRRSLFFFFQPRPPRPRPRFFFRPPLFLLSFLQRQKAFLFSRFFSFSYLRAI